jgi:hypothetical protein
MIRVPEPAPSEPATQTVDAPTTPATNAAARVVATLAHIASTMRTSQYAHRTRVDERVGRFDFDCSGMVGWVLWRAVPAAMRAIHSTRPVASEFAAMIARSPRGHARDGWQHVARFADARPGDVLAWANPRWYPPTDTGHTAFVAAPPRPVRGLPGYFWIRVTDSNVGGYDEDTRAPGASGFGSGQWMVAVDPATGEGSGYVIPDGATRWLFPVRIVVGRLAE